MFDEVVTKDNVNQLVPEYMNCLMRTIRIAVEDVHKLIQKHHITDEKEIEMLESKITELFIMAQLSRQKFDIFIMN